MQIKGGTAAVGGFCFEGNDAMTQFQFELKFPTAELTFWWTEISWKPSSLAVPWGASLLGEKKLLFERFYKKKSDKKQTVVFVDIPYVICVWIVKEGLGLENCLDTLRFLGT